MGIDIACAVVLVIAFLRGYKKGLIMAVFTIIGYVVGIFATMHLSFVISDYLASNFNIPGTWLPLLAFALTFSTVVLVVGFLGKIIEKGMTRILPTSFNRFLGSLLYLAFAIILLSMIYEVATSANIFKENLISDSFSAPHLEHFTGIIEENFGGVIPFVKNLFAEIDAYFREISEQVSNNWI